VRDTVQLDNQNYFYFNPEPQYEGDVPRFPFGYRLFNQRFDGYLLHAGPQVYAFEAEKGMDSRFLLLDQRLVPGDTVEKFSDFLYHLLLDRRQDEEAPGEVFYLLRRRLVGMRSKRESVIWVLSPDRGIVAAADYHIDPASGAVTFDQISGPPRYFDGAGLIQRLKYYDHTTAMVVDRERNLIYKFDKLKGELSSRDFNAGKDLETYQFAPTTTCEWADFRLQVENDQLKLMAEDSCFFFAPELTLQGAGPCP